jgi:hypothetical protein
MISFFMLFRASAWRLRLLALTVPPNAAPAISWPEYLKYIVR